MRQKMEPMSTSTGSKQGAPVWGDIWHGDVPKALSLDVSWTPIPAEEVSSAREGTNIADLDYLVSLGEERERIIALYGIEEENLLSSEYLPRLSDISRLSIEPDNQLLCFDFLFYTSFPSADTSVNIKDISLHTALDTIGIHLHFSRALEDIALQILQMVFPPFLSDPLLYQEEENRFPPYIAVHIRRNDFEQYCPEGPVGGDRSEGCFTPLSTWIQAVNSVQSDLMTKRGPTALPLPVLIFSDEPKRTTPWFMNRFHRPAGTSEAWWAEVDKLGWISIDHQSPEIDTENRWGFWYPILLDQVLMSHAAGYVGTEMSTFSLMAGKRVNGWWGGPVQMVRPVVDGLRP